MQVLVNFVQFQLQNSNAYFLTTFEGKNYDLDNYLARVRQFNELRDLGIAICKTNRNLALSALTALRAEEDSLVTLIQSGADDEKRAVQKEKIAEAMELLIAIGEMRDESAPFVSVYGGERFITMVNMSQTFDEETEEFKYTRSKRVYKEKNASRYKALLKMINHYNKLREDRVKAEIKEAKAAARAEAREAKKLQKKSDTFAEKVHEVKKTSL